MKIGIEGSTCSGKTTFLNYLGFKADGLRKKIKIISERATECPLPLNEKGGMRTQLWIMNRHIEKEYDAQKECPIVITDRTVFAGIAYLQLGQHTIDELIFVTNVAYQWNKAFPYDYVLYFASIPELALSDGAQQFQTKIDKALRIIISDNIPHDRIIYIPYQLKEKRCENTFQILNKLIGE